MLILQMGDLEAQKSKDTRQNYPQSQWLKRDEFLFLTCQCIKLRNTASYLWKLSREMSMETSVFKYKDARNPGKDWQLSLKEG